MIRQQLSDTGFHLGAMGSYVHSFDLGTQAGDSRGQRNKLMPCDVEIDQIDAIQLL